MAAASAALAIATPAVAQEGDASKLSPVLLEVSLNGIAQEVAALLRDPAGRIYAPRAAFLSWRLRLPHKPSLVFEGEDYYLLSAVAGVDTTEDSANQRLSIEAAAEAFQASTVSVAQSRKVAAQAESFGAYLNYDLLAEKNASQKSLGGAVEAVLFTSRGVAAATAVARIGDQSRLTRLDTSWTFDSPERMASLRIGDSFTRGGTGGAPLRFGGIQLARNFATQPGFLTLPLPSVAGSAAAPSVIDVFVNNALASQREVEAGPFRLDELPVVSGSGDVRLIVRDALGRESITTQSYYAAPQLLRKKLHDFSYELGFLRENYGGAGDRYGALTASATHRYGFTDDLTGAVHLEATRSKQVVGLGADILQSRFGVFSASLAASRTRQGSGGLLALGFDRQADGFSIGARGELTSRHYSYVGLPEGQSAPSKTLQAFAGLPTAFGSVSASYLLRDGRAEPRFQAIGASASFRLGWIGSVQLTAQHVVAGERSTRFGLFLTRPLGFNRSASSSVELGSGRRSGTAALQQSLPVGNGLGYRASASGGDFRRIDAWVGYQGSRGLYEAELTRAAGQTGLRAGASGTLGLMGGAVFAARRLTDSFAQVRVDGVEGVRVYANNQLVGRTNKAGIVLVPRLQAYDANEIRIEAADVPFEFSLSEAERTVRPYLRSGVVVRFGSEEVAGGLIKLVGEDGVPLPAGATLTNLQTSESFVVAPGGEAYVTGLAASNPMRAAWGGRSCEFTLPFRKADAARQRLGTFACKEARAGEPLKFTEALGQER